MFIVFVPVHIGGLEKEATASFIFPSPSQPIVIMLNLMQFGFIWNYLVWVSRWKSIANLEWCSIGLL